MPLFTTHPSKKPQNCGLTHAATVFECRIWPAKIQKHRKIKHQSFKPTPFSVSYECRICKAQPFSHNYGLQLFIDHRLLNTDHRPLLTSTSY